MKRIILFFVWAFVSSISYLSAAPTITTQPITQIKDLSATFSGTINVNSVGQWNIDFQIADSDDFASVKSVSPDNYEFYIEGAQVGNNTINSKATQVILSPSTTYYVRFRARNWDTSEHFYGETQTFTTLEASTAPTAEILPHYSPPSISHNEAELRVKVFGGSSLTKVFFLYGVSADNLNLKLSIDDLVQFNKGNELRPNDKTKELKISINELTPSTTYYYRWLVTNTEGSSYSKMETFSTTAPPTLTVLPATNVVTDSAVLNGRVSLNGGMRAYPSFEYGETTEYGKKVDISIR